MVWALLALKERRELMVASAQPELESKAHRVMMELLD
jgi:hypothetical protein